MGRVRFAILMAPIEPAQEVVRSMLFCPLIDTLARESFDNGPLLDYICPLLNFSLEYCKKQDPSLWSRVNDNYCS